MPTKPKRPCRHCGCPALTDHKTGYCETHRSAADLRRGSARDRGYSYRWEQARLLFLRSHPLCAECERNGRVTVATVVDHIIPHKGNQELFWDVSNWQVLCAYHHNVKTAKEDGGFGIHRK